MKTKVVTRKIAYGYFLLGLLALLFLPTFLFCAERENPLLREYEQLQRKYFKLRNTDPELGKRESWTGIFHEIESFARKNAGESAAAYALYDLAAIKNRLKDYEESIAFLEKIASRYSQHELADDALYQAAQTSRRHLQDEERASRFESRILNEYPETEHAALLVSKSSLRETSERDTPQLQRDSSIPIPIVVLDPGHGGEDHGALGKAGLLEKDVALDVALRLEEELRKNLGAIVHLTRRDDRFIPLAKRTEFANELGADIFLSLHSNASRDGSLSGYQVFTLDNARNAAAKKLAERENASASDDPVWADLQFILSDLIQAGKQEESEVLADSLIDTLSDLRSNYGLRQQVRKRQKAPFYVLVGAHMPCALIEMFFIDHEKDGRLLSSGEFRDDVARALFQGLERYWQVKTAK